MTSGKSHHANRQRGFTLVEVIVTIIAAGILAAFFVQFMGTSMSRASNTVERVRVESAGEATVENIIAFFVTQMNNDSPPALSTLEEDIKNNFDDTPAGIDVKIEWIAFDTDGNEIATAEKDTLKVTVENKGHSQIFLLTQSRIDSQPPLDVELPHVRY